MAGLDGLYKTSLIPSEVEGLAQPSLRPSTQFIPSDAEDGVEGLGMSEV